MKPRRFASDTMASMRLAGSAGMGMDTVATPEGGGQCRVAACTSRLRAGPGGQPWTVMKVSFTTKEYRQLLELAHLGMWVGTGYQGGDTALANCYLPSDPNRPGPAPNAPDP